MASGILSLSAQNRNGIKTLTQDSYSQSSTETISKSNTDFLDSQTKRESKFEVAFPNGLTIGACGRTVLLTSASAVQKFLSNSGTPEILALGEFTNPTNIHNTLAGQTVALTLNVKFNMVNKSSNDSIISVGNLVITSGIFKGISVNQLLDIANNTLGGCSNYSPSDVNNNLYAFNNKLFSWKNI
jgi:hypothetical protein